MAEELAERVPDPDYFFRKRKEFPWSILGLDRPFYGPLHSYLCSLCAKYENDSKIRTYLSSRPTWRSIEKFANAMTGDEENWYISRIHNFCSRYYSLRESERRSVDEAAVDFMEDVPEFKKEFAERLKALYIQGRLNLKPEMTRLRIK